MGAKRASRPGQEVEIKLELSPKELEKLRVSAWFSELGAGQSKQLLSEYFDTPKRKLRRRGVSLRVRHDGERRLQTVKARSARQALARTEHEHEIDGDVPQLAAEPLVSKKLEHKLQPVFETRVERTSFPIQLPAGSVEFSIDQGEIRAGDDSQPISELEIELKAGASIALTEVAKQLSHEFKVSLEVRSKAERGYALADRDCAQATHAEPIALERFVTASAAFPIIGLSCLRQCALNQPLVRAGDAEGVHQMRVALRRLRAAISLFEDMLVGAETESVKARLRWLTEQLGPTRDYDVFLERCALALKKPGVHRHELEQLEVALRARRAQEVEQAQRAVESDRYRQLLLETALWLLGGAWASASDEEACVLRQKHLRKLAGAALGKRRKKLVTKLERLHELQPVERHELRIAVKKLHYWTDFSAALFSDRKPQRERFVRQLERLQALLGELNDMHIHETLAQGVVSAAVASESGVATAFAVGLIQGTEQTKARGLIKVAARAGEKLAGMPKFWE